MTSTHQTLVLHLQTSLQQVASPETKAWWEKYLKQVIPFRGLSLPKTREQFLQWYKYYQVHTFSLETQLEMALTLFRAPFTEDKLAGILFLQYYLYMHMDWRYLLKKYETIYAEAFIFDWNTCDWFCLKVLTPMIIQEGEACAQGIIRWKEAPYLWQARSSIVPFVKVADQAHYYPLIETASTALIQREERFAKTAVGWILREISKHDPTFVKAFIDTHIAYFSKESLRNALKYFDSRVRKTYIK